MSEEEREPGQNPRIHEQAEPVAEPKSDDTNELADDKVEILEPDGSPSPDSE
jgi:hypothetical protein